MAMIDYGCAVKVNGELIDFHGSLFMECPEWVPDKVYNSKGESLKIRDNYFAYVGDLDFYICFYKTICLVCSGDKVLYSSYNPYFNSVRFFEQTNVSIKHIDDNIYAEECYNSGMSWEEYVRENWIGATGKEKLSELDNGYNTYKYFMKTRRQIGRLHNKGFAHKTSKYIASWNYNGNKYEVVYGYGIDADVKTYNLIKDKHYDYTKREIKFLDEWFVK